MRPLPDLTNLDQQPSVFDSTTDDFTAAFASEFNGADSNQQVLDSQTPATLTALGPIGAMLDGIDGLLSAATDVLGLLSGDLDAVNLDPIISNYQSYDSALDSNLSNPIFDFTQAAQYLFGDIFSIANYVAQGWADWAFNTAMNNIMDIFNTIEAQFSQIPT